MKFWALIRYIKPLFISGSQLDIEKMSPHAQLIAINGFGVNHAGLYGGEEEASSCLENIYF